MPRTLPLLLLAIVGVGIALVGAAPAGPSELDRRLEARRENLAARTSTWDPNNEQEHTYTCGHGTDLARFVDASVGGARAQDARGRGRFEDESGRSSRRRQSPATYDPIQFDVDYSPLDGETDPNVCTADRVGQAVILDRSGTSYNCTEDDVLTDAHKDLLRDILDEALGILSDIISVHALELPLQVTVGSNPIQCLSRELPADSTVEYDGTYGLYVHSQAIPGGGSGVLAFAGPCVQTTDFLGRPLVGFVNFGPQAIRAIDTSSDLSRRQALSAAAHEMIHAMGFTFRTEETEFSDSSLPDVRPTLSGPGFWDPINRRFMEDDEVFAFYNVTTSRGAQIFKYGIKTPTVLLRAALHFGCDHLNAVPLEDDGAGGTQLLHWEKRVFYDEFFTGVVLPNTPAVMSAITMAFLEDTGWYRIDYSMIPDTISNIPNNFAFGKAEGCAFVSGPCNALPNPEGYFCSAPEGGFPNENSEPKLIGAETCSYDRTSKAICQYEYHGTNPDPSLIPTADEAWYGPSEPLSKWGGFGSGSAVADFCSIPNPDYNIVQSCLSQGSLSDESDEIIRGEKFCERCRCVEATLEALDEGLLGDLEGDVVETELVPSPFCIEMYCAGPNRLKVRAGLHQPLWYDCPTGAEIDIKNYLGTLQCPDNSVFCAGESIDPNWPEITQIDPQNTPIDNDGGELFTIYGSNFASNARVFVGEFECDVETRTSTEIVATTPLIESLSPEDFDSYVVVMHPEPAELEPTAQLFGSYRVMVNTINVAASLENLQAFLDDNGVYTAIGAILGLLAAILINFWCHFRLRRRARRAGAAVALRKLIRDEKIQKSSQEKAFKIRAEYDPPPAKGQKGEAEADTEGWAAVLSLPVGEQASAPQDQQYGLTLEQAKAMDPREGKVILTKQFVKVLRHTDFDDDGVIGGDDFVQLLKHISFYWRLGFTKKVMRQFVKASETEEKGFVVWADFVPVGVDIAMKFLGLAESGASSSGAGGVGDAGGDAAPSGSAPQPDAEQASEPAPPGEPSADPETAAVAAEGASSKE